MKLSSYPVLDNRPIDQWKVTELKEELKRRKLTTKGLKDDLVRRLDEDLRKEMGAEKEKADNGVDEVVPDSVIEDAATEETAGFETGGLGLGLGNSGIDVEKVGYADDGIVKLDDVPGQIEIEDSVEQPVEKNSDEQQLGLGSDNVSDVGKIATSDVPGSDLDDKISENLLCEKAVDEEGLQDGKMGRDNEGSRAQDQSEEVKPLRDAGKLDSSESINQVSEVSSSLGFPVKSNSICTDNVSLIEKNELKDNIITNNVNLESDVKPEMVQPSSSDLVADGGESHPSDVEEPLGNKVFVQDTGNNVTNVDVSQKNYSADLGSSEKLNLDRSSGDDSMGEDASESKHIDSNNNSEEVVEESEKNEDTTKDEILVATMDVDVPANDKGTHHENKSVAAVVSADKRKPSDQESVLNNEPTKRQRRWKSESNSFKEPPVSNTPPQSAVKDVPQPALLKRNFSGSKFMVGADEPPKEREVPPSLKPATNSLRIDRFLRPFTLKAVQELLGKTGTVASFWMDHIKTHCYVTFSSVEEAIETRNAVYNLQWPPNGGRNLVAEFVDLEEVKARLEPPPSPSPAAPVSSGPTVPKPPSTMPQPSSRQQNLKQQMAQPTLPPPPPLTNPPQARERERAFPPPPPPPQNEKVEAPIVTLDDLFRKTKATPRIYYLPLSEEQVSAVLEARRGNSTKQ